MSRKKPFPESDRVPTPPQMPQPICPHCNEPVTFIQWMDFAGGLIKVVYHKDCNKVLGVVQ